MRQYRIITAFKVQTDKGDMAKRRIKDIRAEVAKATVKLTQKGGQGILVGKEMIITAAHCLEFDCKGGIVLGENIVAVGNTQYGIETARGEKLKVAPMAIEPVNDIAVLGWLDYQTDEAEDFIAFCERTKPIPLYCRPLEDFLTEFRVHIYTHKKTWIRGKASISAIHDPMMRVISEKNIEGGTSGGPIINDSGELVGIVSNTVACHGGEEVLAPVLQRALPIWIYHRLGLPLVL